MSNYKSKSANQTPINRRYSSGSRERQERQILNPYPHPYVARSRNNRFRKIDKSWSNEMINTYKAQPRFEDNAESFMIRQRPLVVMAGKRPTVGPGEYINA